ncbi:hypothetical protein OsI_36945 [Oryza sativa Indica Group]|uniref:Uncharacterized protein n=4 Tax=Oryza TaxID=4527 RepID=A0A8J8XTL2_ORYSJ|nr:hypothetical protein LOC_Os11g44320 [Oryza sativa Japonica Group]EAY81771.1 hypothetical protein OsI_36945 [Oryza sativa Indica Group]EAZ19212.1 hypothetical protein OsJ_34751 [Oryza sativa Japonica Group]
MALWGGLGQAATVAQLVGADIGGLITMIMQVAMTAAVGGAASHFGSRGQSREGARARPLRRLC